MAGNGWKVVMNADGVTIGSDQFQLTTAPGEPTQLGTVITELQNITRDNYGQYCGLARAAEMIGERWGMLIVRDLLVSPKTVTELRNGLPRISADVVVTRLREMEYSGVIRRQDPTEDRAEATYELTEYGRSVEDVLLALSRWGAQTLARPRPEDITTENSLVIALRSTFQADKAVDYRVSFELHVDGNVVHAAVDHGTLNAGTGPLPGADLVIDSGTELKGLMSNAVSAEEAIATGQVVVTGDEALLSTFVELFALPAAAAPAKG
jgi:DNA-binding HxlR family transcriptional regulator